MIRNNQYPLYINFDKIIEENSHDSWILIHPQTGEEFVLSDSPIKIESPIESLFLTKQDVIPGEYSLHQNYPNPFNPVTSIQYEIPSISNVRLTVYDLIGREIAELVNETKMAGTNSIVWNGKSNDGAVVANGVYFYSIEAGEFQSVKKMIFMK